MDTTNDIIKSINDLVKERVRSPFYGYFALAWICYNWEIILVLFFEPSEKFAGTKYSFIRENLISGSEMIVYPFFSAIAILVVASLAATGFYWISLRFKYWNKKIYAKEYKLKVITEDERQDLIKSIIEKENNANELVRETLVQRDQLTEDKIKCDSEILRLNGNLRKVEKDHDQLMGLSDNIKQEYIGVARERDTLLRSQEHLLTFVLKSINSSLIITDNATKFRDEHRKQLYILLNPDYNKEIMKFMKGISNLKEDQSYSDDQLKENLGILYSSAKHSGIIRKVQSGYILNSIGVYKFIREMKL